MPYVAPATKSANTKLTSAEWNTVVNDIIDLNTRIVICTSATRPASPTAGLLIYETDTSKRYVYNGTVYLETTGGPQLLTTTQRNALVTPSTGTLVFDTTLNELFVYGISGAAWFGLGNSVICTSATRPTTLFAGQTIYETDTFKTFQRNATVSAWLETTNGYPILTTAQIVSLGAVAFPTVGATFFDSTLRQKVTYISTASGNAYVPFGNYLSSTLANRPSTPFVGQLFYQTDTDEMVKYVADNDYPSVTTNRWMQASPEYRRNMVSNGGFDVWQRGITFNPVSGITTTGLNYGADRWQFVQATTSAAAFTRQSITATDPVGFNYFARVQRVAAAAHVTPYTVQTSFESQNIPAVRGRYVTLSFWARAGANYSAASGFLVSNIVTGTGTDNTTGNFTTNTVNTTTNNVLTTSWKRFVVTTSAVLATSITQLGVSFVFTPVGAAGAADYFDITGVQLEVGTAPSDFEFRDFGEEVRRCQRYYYRIQSDGNQQSGLFGAGFATGVNTARLAIPYPVVLRSSPSAIETSSTAADYAVLTQTGTTNCTSVPTIIVASRNGASTQWSCTAGFTAAGVGVIGASGSATGASAYLGFNAEL